MKSNVLSSAESVNDAEMYEEVSAIFLLLIFSVLLVIKCCKTRVIYMEGNELDIFPARAIEMHIIGDDDDLEV